MPITDKQIKKIELFALHKYSELDYPHSVNHAYRSVKLAEFLAKREGADILVCKLGALLHQYHPEEAHKVEEFLQNIGLGKSLRKQIVHCIESVARSTVYKARTLEAKVVFDADKLQIIGPFGLIREISHRIITKKINFHTAIKESKELQEDIYTRLQTKTAKELSTEPHRFTQKFFKIFNKWDKVDLNQINHTNEDS